MARGYGPQAKLVGKCADLVANALPFGAVASVLGFNRAAHAIKSLIVRGLNIPCGHYFDDFPMVVPAEIATACDIAVKTLGEVTGWAWKGGEKDLPFSSNFKLLGTHVDLNGLTSTNTLTVSITTARHSALVETIQSVLRSQAC